MEVLIEGAAIREVSDRLIASAGADRVDLAANAQQPSSLATLRAGQIMAAMLRRGFTTVRDMGGADHGLAEAQAAGVAPGPRLVISGKALSHTGESRCGRKRCQRWRCCGPPPPWRRPCAG